MLRSQLNGNKKILSRLDGRERREKEEPGGNRKTGSDPVARLKAIIAHVIPR